MYKNLAKAAQDKHLAYRAIAAAAGLSDSTFCDKIKGSNRFKVAEAFAIKKSLFPEYDFEYLFAEDGDTDESDE